MKRILTNIAWLSPLALPVLIALFVSLPAGALAAVALMVVAVVLEVRDEYRESKEGGPQ